MSRRSRRRVTLALVMAVIVAVVVTLVISARDTDRRDKALDMRLEELRTAIAEPTPPSEAALISRRDYKGDLVSDGPAIAWTYSFSGDDAHLVEHYQTTLTSSGWTYRPPHGFPGQLALFDRTLRGDYQSITVDVGPDKGTFVVTAYG